MQALRILEGVAGAVLVLVAGVDVVSSVIVPRPVTGLLRPSRLVVRAAWGGFRRLAPHAGSLQRREQVLGVFAPLIVLLLLAGWACVMVLGYGLLLHALHDELRPPGTDDLAIALYLAGASLLTIGFGDVVAADGPARLVTLFAGATGLGLFAVVITFLFSLYASFQQRENLVVRLDSRAGAPPSGVTLLETHARLELLDQLPRLFREWEQWAAHVLDSHVAYPVLGYFRSTHDNESWVSACGAVLDAATLTLTAVEDLPRGPARLFYGIGCHLFEDLGRIYAWGADDGPGVERTEFDAACERLRGAGLSVDGGDVAWERFARLRSVYAGTLNRMARQWLIPPTQWIGDRSTLRDRLSSGFHR